MPEGSSHWRAMLLPLLTATRSLVKHRPAYPSLLLFSSSYSSLCSSFFVAFYTLVKRRACSHTHCSSRIRFIHFWYCYCLLLLLFLLLMFNNKKTHLKLYHSQFRHTKKAFALTDSVFFPLFLLFFCFAMIKHDCPIFI